MGARFWPAAIILLVAVPSGARAHRPEAWARSQFANAEHSHQELEARPAPGLTRSDYQRVINAYRRVYFEAPSSSKADPSVLAVAQLLEEMGRRFEDQTILRSAIRQYEFLRRQYPGSKARFAALFRTGEIYRDDLHDKAHADEIFQEFLRRYPRNQFAQQARQELLEPVVPDPKAKSSASSIRVDHDEESPAETSLAGDQKIGTSAQNLTPSGKTASVGVVAVRHWSTGDTTHVAVDLQRDVKYESQRLTNPDRIFFDLQGSKLDASLNGRIYQLNESLVKKIRISQFSAHRTRLVLEVGQVAAYQAALVENPPRLLIDVRKEQPVAAKMPVAADRTPATLARAAESKPNDTSADDPPRLPPSKEPLSLNATTALPKLAPSKNKPARNLTFVTNDGVVKTIVDDEDTTAEAAGSDAHKATSQSPVDTVPVKVVGDKSKRKTATENADVREAQPTAAGDRSLIRALGLKIGKIVIDPGHGGHDTGTIGPHGLEEKELVLDVSMRLGKLLASRLGAQVVYTRSDDTFIPLETRTAIANQEAADLFVSIHANSSRDPDARGVETYYLNFNSSPDALEVAARENAVSEASIHELQDLVKQIALKEKIDESREFAVDVEHSLHSGLAAKNSGVRDRGVKKAPFIVLIGANMPSILAEISFVSNPADERRLTTSDYRQRIAESLYRGIAKYINGLSGIKVASKIEKTGSE